MKTFALSNLVASTVREVLPWEEPSNPPVSVKSKTDMTEWSQQPTTKACFWSPYEGLNAGLRVTSDENEAIYLHGFVADYDSIVSDEDFANIPKRSKFEFLPNRACRTFSGGARLVWEFPEPLLLTSTAVAKAFLKIAKKKMSLTRLLPGLDSDAFYSPTTYYESGRDWQTLSSDKIPIDYLWVWMVEAGNAVKPPRDELRIPINVIAAEVEKRFPGRWTGPFELGTRGLRFWDPDAKNKSAAVVREGGMQCFTGPLGFVTWEGIFGATFVSEFTAVNIGALLKSWWYDGKQYWYDEGTSWTFFSKEDFKLVLRVKHGLSARAIRRGEPSEIEDMTYKVQTQKRVDGVFPRVHTPSGLYFEGSSKLLNTSTIKCLKPHSSSTGAWGVEFPWIANFLDTLLESSDMTSGASQKEFFLSWLKWFYENGYHQKPKAGQAIFLAGGVGVGKTLLTNNLISKMVGGHQDAREFLIGEAGRFTDYLFEKPLWTMDDATPATNVRLQERFSANVKRMVANEYHYYDKKFGVAGQVRWLGRLAITCNTDHESIRILPCLEISNREKISLFKVADIPINFPDREEITQIIDDELPLFCRWLLDWEVPLICLGEKRYGVKAYHDPDLLEASMQGDSVASFAELLDEFRMRFFLALEEPFWTGTSTTFLATLVATPDLEKVCRIFGDSRLIGRSLGKLMTRGCSYIRASSTSGARVWHIDCHPSNYSPYMRKKYSEIVERQAKQDMSPDLAEEK